MFRFNATRRAKIRLGSIRLIRRASIGAEGSTKQTRWGRHLSSKTTGLRDLRQRVSALFQDHEIFVRTHGHVRFLRVSAVWQKRVALIAGAVLLAWAGATLAVLINQLLTADERAARSEEHTSELQSLMRISYAVFCLK